MIKAAFAHATMQKICEIVIELEFISRHFYSCLKSMDVKFLSKFPTDCDVEPSGIKYWLLIALINNLLLF